MRMQEVFLKIRIVLLRKDVINTSRARDKEIVLDRN